MPAISPVATSAKPRRRATIGPVSRSATPRPEDHHGTTGGAGRWTTHGRHRGPRRRDAGHAQPSL